MVVFRGKHNGVDLLYETGIECRSDPAGSRAGDVDFVYVVIGVFMGSGKFFEESQQGRRLFGVVWGIGFGDDVEIRVAEDVLDCGGADINTQNILFFRFNCTHLL